MKHPLLEFKENDFCAYYIHAIYEIRLGTILKQHHGTSPGFGGSNIGSIRPATQKRVFKQIKKSNAADDIYKIPSALFVRRKI